jgi:transcriptional regulator with XRE-family HTH domain
MHSPTAISFGARLRQLRTAAGLSQTALAQRAGLTRMAVAHLEMGRRQPTWATAVALADALGVSTEAFREPPAPGPETTRGRPPAPRPASPKRRRGSPNAD